MLLKLSDGSVYVAHFEHHDEIVDRTMEGQFTGRCIRRRRWTDCRLHAGPCPEDRCDVVHWSGRATCSERDQFAKSVGRKLALTRALESWTLSTDEPGRPLFVVREFRRAIWLAYFAATNRMPAPRETTR